MIADYLNEGLTATDRSAALIVEKYLQRCNDVVHQHGKWQQPIDGQLLAWTTLYHERKQLESAFANGQPVNWLRVVCFVLDQKRLKDAIKLATECSDALSRKRHRSCDEDDCVIVESRPSDAVGVASATKRLRLNDSEDGTSHQEAQTLPPPLHYCNLKQIQKTATDQSCYHQPERSQL